MENEELPVQAAPRFRLQEECASSIMVRVPMFHSLNVLDGAPDAPHPMFVVDDMTVPEVYFSKYQNIVMHDRAYSLPFKDPRTYIDLQANYQQVKMPRRFSPLRHFRDERKHVPVKNEFVCARFGGPEGIRTLDLCVANAALSRAVRKAVP